MPAVELNHGNMRGKCSASEDRGGLNHGMIAIHLKRIEFEGGKTPRVGCEQIVSGDGRKIAGSDDEPQQR